VGLPKAFLVEPKADFAMDMVGIKNFIQEKGTRNRPLSEMHKSLNRLNSQIRCKIELIFGFMENSMGGPEK
jgi:hypothetical protein